jgi:hypothetical protein
MNGHIFVWLISVRPLTKFLKEISLSTVRSTQNYQMIINISWCVVQKRAAGWLWCRAHLEITKKNILSVQGCISGKNRYSKCEISAESNFDVSHMVQWFEIKGMRHWALKLIVWLKFKIKTWKFLREQKNP